MKKALFLGISLAAVATAPALAADLAQRTYTKAPAYVPAPIYSWAGFYLGINAGAAWSHNCWDLNGINVVGPGAPIVPISPAIGEGCHNASGAVVGGQIGYRWQFTNFVVGVEAQGDWADLKGSTPSSPAALFPLVNQTKLDAIGLFTGQVGYAWSNVLWYVKGGAAVTHDKYNGFLAGVTADQASETRWGGAVGTGFEFGFAPGWSFGVEYDHLFMGDRTLTFTTVTAFPGTPFRTDRIRQDIDMATLRLNYTFGGPVVARY
jgi:outer membrane immunogenic protein